MVRAVKKTCCSAENVRRARRIFRDGVSGRKNRREDIVEPVSRGERYYHRTAGPRNRRSEEIFKGIVSRKGPAVVRSEQIKVRARDV